jgi:hypothetical protein
VETALARRQRLIQALRQEMPEGYRWKFGHYYRETYCGTSGCAIGLAHLLFPECNLIIENKGVVLQNVAEGLGMTFDDVMRIFHSNGYRGQGQRITPAMVADALERETMEDAAE